MDWKTLFPIIPKFVEWVTGRRVLMLALAGVVGITLYTSWGHREDIAKVIVSKLGNQQSQSAGIPDLNIDLSPEVKQRIRDSVDKSGGFLNYVAVVSSNIRINQRQMVFFYSPDAVIQQAVKSGSWHEGSTQAIFTSKEKENEQMVSVINGEFGCFPYQDTLQFESAPELLTRLPYFCRVSLPPYYGEFSGYIVYGMKAKPDESKINEIRIEAVRLATEVYFKTVGKAKSAPGT